MYALRGETLRNSGYNADLARAPEKSGVYSQHEATSKHHMILDGHTGVSNVGIWVGCRPMIDRRSDVL